jgi:hypothetical protein
MAHIDIRVVEGDLLTTNVELVCFKHAQSFYGADLAAVERLTAQAGLAEALFSVPSGDVRVVATAGALAAPRAAFLGTVRLGDLRYHELRLLAARMLLVAQAEGARTMATTVHGVQAGLDESEAVLALVGGLIDGFQRGLGGALTEVIVVESHAGPRPSGMRAALAAGLASTARRRRPRRRLPHRAQRRLHPGRVRWPAPARRRWPSRTRSSPCRSRPELDDAFHYGIAGPVKAAGLLCERVDQAVFDGLIIGRIRERIDSARVVIADLSMANPNVYLEVGYAWGRGRPTILLVRDLKELRFDVQGYRCLVVPAASAISSSCSLQGAGGGHRVTLLAALRACAAIPRTPRGRARR